MILMPAGLDLGDFGPWSLEDPVSIGLDETSCSNESPVMDLDACDWLQF